MMFPYDQSAGRLLLINYTDTSSEDGNVGVYAPDGTINVTILDSEESRVSIYATNGSINVVQGSGRGVYSPCGALNVTIPEG